jgi:hypothetical protein
MAPGWQFRNGYFGGVLPNKLFVLSLMVGTYLNLSDGGFAYAAEQKKADFAPAVLSNAQLDRVTAGSTTLSLELAAHAQGPTATTTTEGSVQGAPTTILLVATDPREPQGAQVHLLGALPVDLIFASGRATATGGNSPDCSAKIDIVDVANIAFITQMSSTITGANSATCSCAAFAIARVAQ